MPVRAAYHDACHLGHAQGITAAQPAASAWIITVEARKTSTTTATPPRSAPRGIRLGRKWTNTFARWAGSLGLVGSVLTHLLPYNPKHDPMSGRARPLLLTPSKNDTTSFHYWDCVSCKPNQIGIARIS